MGDGFLGVVAGLAGVPKGAKNEVRVAPGHGRLIAILAGRRRDTAPKREDRAADGWGNLLAGIRRDAPDEEFRALLTRPGLRVERIVSTGQISADWHDQPQDEWVLLVEGGARLFMEGEGELVLGAGDHLLIPAHVRHRVTWTDPERPTIWLAVHFPASGG